MLRLTLYRQRSGAWIQWGEEERQASSREGVESKAELVLEIDAAIHHPGLILGADTGDEQ